MMKMKIGFSIFALLLLSIAVHAQTLPCGGTDPDAICPLDTWVIILVIAASIFSVFNLYRRQKSALARDYQSH